MSDYQPTPPTSSPYTGSPNAVQKTNTLAIIALILGIVVPIGGIICGPIALGQIKRTGEGGRGLAMAGLIIGIVFTVLGLLWFGLVGVAVMSSINSGVYNSTP